MTGWTVTGGGIGLGGEAQVLTSLGDLSPTGPRFALIDTGPALTLGSVTPSLGELSQSFTLGSAATLTFSVRYALLTALFTGSFATDLDRFIIEVTPNAGGGATNLLSENVGLTTFLSISNGPAVSPSGSQFYEATPSAILNSAFALGAGSYTLRFRVENATNSQFDSGMLIESVTLDDGVSSGVPEPSSMALLLGGVGAAILARRRSQMISKGMEK